MKLRLSDIIKNLEELAVTHTTKLRLSDIIKNLEEEERKKPSTISDALFSKLEKSHKELLGKIEDAYQELSDSIENIVFPESTPQEIRDKLASLKKNNRLDVHSLKGIEQIEDIINDLQKIIDTVEIAHGNEIKDIYKKMGVLFKAIEDLKNVSITPNEIRDKLQSLTGIARLDASAIKNLPAGGAVKRGGGMKLEAIDLSSQCDGSNKTFTITKSKLVLGLWSTQFPQIYRPTTDFTSTATTIVLTSEVSAPESGQTLITLIVL